jgi:two-component system sensor histidine kinase/response regulator
MKRILVIEDERDVRNNILELLSAEGYEATGASEGEEGFRLAWEKLPDLIICDIRMPGMDGYGVLARLRKEPRTITIPFLYLTALHERQDMRKGMQLGADDFITKPFSREELLDAVQARLEKHTALVDHVQKRITEMRTYLVRSLPYELLTPLSSVLGFSELIIDNLNHMSTDQVRDIAQDIHNSGMRLMRLVQNYILLTDLEIIISDPTKIDELRESKIQSARTIITEISLSKALHDGRENDLKIVIEESTIRISEISLQKIVEELLDNAFHYSVVGSLVEVKGYANANESHFRLEVMDHGQGMSTQLIQAVSNGMHYERIVYEQHGIGMGLVIVKRLVELYGGSVNIQSDIGFWTTVEIILPKD